MSRISFSFFLRSTFSSIKGKRGILKFKRIEITLTKVIAYNYVARTSDVIREKKKNAQRPSSSYPFLMRHPTAAFRDERNREKKGNSSLAVDDHYDS